MSSSHNTALSPDHLRQLEQQLADAGCPFAVATVIRAQSPTSTWAGAQALVESDGTLHGWVGGGCARGIVIQAALEAMLAGQPKRVRISNGANVPDPDIEDHAMPCASNGTLELFIQPSVPAPVALILGATPVALEAYVLAQRAGFRVCAAAHARQAYEVLGVPHVVEGFDAQTLAALGPALVLVATQGDGDEDALEAALRTPAAGVLLIASQRKSDVLRETMRLRGIPEERLAALHAPAGPRIRVRTPQEIALAAVAGLIDLRRTLEEGGMSLSAAHAQQDPSLTQRKAPATYINPVCGIAVEIATARHVVERGGQRVYFCCDGCLQTFEQAPDRYLEIASRNAQQVAP